MNLSMWLHVAVLHLYNKLYIPKQFIHYTIFKQSSFEVANV